MKDKKWRFKPGLTPSLALLFFLPLLLWLGFWQLDRAEQKRVWRETWAQRQNMPALQLGQGGADLSYLESQRQILWRQINVTGVFDEQSQILLDSQVMHSRAGYFVFTPLVLPGESMQFLVNRGWVPAGHDRSKLPRLIKTQGELTLHAVIKEPPVTGIKLKDHPPEQMASGIYRVHNIDVAALSALLGRDFFAYVLRLHADSEHGYDRSWSLPAAGIARHLGYAFQWFALAFVLVVLYIVLNIEKIKIKA